MIQIRFIGGNDVDFPLKKVIFSIYCYFDSFIRVAWLGFKHLLAFTSYPKLS